MSAVDEGTKTDPLQGLDFDATVPCVARECDRVATWALTILCPCRHGSLMCDEHHDRWVADAAKKVVKHSAVCGDCPDHPALPKPYYVWRHL